MTQHQDLVPDGSGGPHVFVDDVNVPILADDDVHHLERVRRLRVGDPITVCDGAGRWRSATYAPSPEPTGEIIVVPQPEPRVVIGLAAVKGDRTSWAVQKLTELGADEIVIIESARSVVRWKGDRSTKAIERLEAVVRSAAVQSRRVHLPVLTGPIPAAQALAWPGAVVAQRGGDRPDLLRSTVMIGPEGGWSPEELDMAQGRLDLGPGVLRAETAALAAVTLLTSLRNLLVHGHSE